MHKKTGCGRDFFRKGEEREGKKRGKKVIHRKWGNVEKECTGFQQGVEKRGKVCYNCDMTEKMPDFGRMKRLLEEKRAQFEAFYSLLLHYNAAFNLTAITQQEEVFHKHFLDSLAGENFLKQGARVAEVGSGAGFPSVPLAIVRGDLSFTLIESTGKKCNFLRTVARELGLKLDVLCMRAEEAGRTDGMREHFDAVIARAVAPLPALAEYCLPLARVGGEMIAWKGSEDETSAAQFAVQVLGGGRLRTVRYELPAGYGERMLVLAEKVRPTPAKYPRGRGLERKDPIGQKRG